MSGLLKISDIHPDRDYLAFDIADLLALIPDEGSNLMWSVFPIGEGTQITGKVDELCGMDVEEFCWQVDESDTGVILSWQEMIMLAASVQQTIQGTYIGCKSEATFDGLTKLFEDDWIYLDRVRPAFHEAVEVAFQAIDSSFWLVYARDDVIVERIRNAFRAVEMIQASISSGD